MAICTVYKARSLRITYQLHFGRHIWITW